MSDRDYSEVISDALKGTGYRGALHQFHSPLVPGADISRHDGDFLVEIADLSNGAALCMELVMGSELERSMIIDGSSDDQAKPILNPHDTEVAGRFAIAAMRLLSHHAQLRIERLNAEAQRKKGGHHE